MATVSSLKKKQQELQDDQDLLTDRWTKVLAAKEHEFERPSKSYPKRRLLPHLKEEALKPHSPVYDVVDWPPRGRAREAFRVTHGTCETYWTVRQNSQGQYTGHEHARQHGTMIVAPDTPKANPAGPNTADKTHMNCVEI